MENISIKLIEELDQMVESGQISHLEMVNALKNNLNEKKKLYSEYYKIKQEYFNYKGERYFKHSYNADSILQVCFATKSNIKKITQI